MLQRLGLVILLLLLALNAVLAAANGEYSVSMKALLRAAETAKNLPPTRPYDGCFTAIDAKAGQQGKCINVAAMVAQISSTEVKAVKPKKQPLPELHHVVGVPLLKTMHPPAEKMPLGEKQELVCETCHGIEHIDEIPVEKVDKKANNFLKGGPYAQLTDFCYQCHEKKTYGRQNIHMLLDYKGKIKEEQCKYCHEEVLKRDRVYKPEELKLRMPRENLCFGCHLKTPHFNALQHQVKPSKEKLEQLKRSEKDLGIILPLSSDGKVMCVTCHSPHPPGVLDDKLKAAKQVKNNDLKTGVSYVEHPWGEVFAADKETRLEKLERETGQLHSLEYQRIKTEVLLRLPAKDGSLCLACHTFTDRE